MRLTEAAFTEIVDAGCPKCLRRRVTVETYVAQKLPLLNGEPYGSPSWGYKGEELVNGTYRIACTDCDHELFSDSNCPCCDAEAGLERGLETENEYPLPTKCLGCGSELVTASAYVPATVAYEGKRGAKARTQTAPEDPGFHAYRAECKQCGHSAARTKPCPLCGR
jgi:hypothetical protein